MPKHIHADIIKAWADGAEIQILSSFYTWENVRDPNPSWDPNSKYRIKPRTVSREGWVIVSRKCGEESQVDPWIYASNESALIAARCISNTVAIIKIEWVEEYGQTPDIR